MKISKITAAVISAAAAVTAVTVTVFAAGTVVTVNEENFPDVNFREFVSENFDTDKNGKLSQKELDAVTRIDVNSMEISSVKGVEKFTKIEYLNCSGNKLTELDVSKNTRLNVFGCNACGLTELDVSKNTKLEHFECRSNKLTELDLSKNTELVFLPAMTTN